MLCIRDNIMFHQAVSNFITSIKRFDRERVRQTDRQTDRGTEGSWRGAAVV